jgi:hypothetical protein
MYWPTEDGEDSVDYLQKVDDDLSGIKWNMPADEIAQAIRGAIDENIETEPVYTS